MVFEVAVVGELLAVLCLAKDDEENLTESLECQ